MARVRTPPIRDRRRFEEWLKTDLEPQVERSRVISHTFAAANTPERIRHGLDSVPEGYHLVDADRACSIFRGSTAPAADKRYIWLECDQVGAVVKVRVF